jgi:adenylate cyclase
MWNLSFLAYGTKGYPETVARRLRVVNFTTWCTAAFAVPYAITQFLDPTPGIWKPALVNASAAVVLAFIPLLHRLSAIAAPIAYVAVAFVTISVLIWFFGTDNGMQIQFLAVAAASVLFFDTSKVWFMIAIGFVAAVLMIAAEVLVPPSTGLMTDPAMFVNFIGCVAGTCAILFAVVFYAVRTAARAEATAERERARSEALLLNILPAGIAERLKTPAHDVIADRYEEASILFADMAGFTARASDTDPADLIQFLNSAFSSFDRLVEAHGLEKIKTTGDAYMVVSGVPAPRADHASALARLALDMLSASRELRDAHGAGVPLRIGMATGPVVAGVVGSKKFFYDVWGDAVNVASRMESTGEAGRIQVPEPLYQRLKEAFRLEPRGIVDVKGKGQLATWFLTGPAGHIATGHRSAV